MAVDGRASGATAAGETDDVPRARRRRRWLWAAVLVGAPLAFVALLVAQALAAARAERLPDDPGYAVEGLVSPRGAADGEPLRMAVLGDSTVAGVGTETLEGSLPFQIAERMVAGLDRPVRFMGYGVTGARTDDIIPEQLPRVQGFDPDVVVIVVGSNDVTGLTPPWRLSSELADIAAAVEQQLGVPVVLGGIPLFGEAGLLGEPLRSVVGTYAAALRPTQRDAARAAGMAYVEIARDASPRFVGVPDAMSSDGFHPGPVGYGFWADAIAPGVVAALADAPQAP